MGNVTFWTLQAGKIIPCPRTIICNNCEQINVLGEILSASYNDEDQEYYGVTGSFYKIAPTVIDESTKMKLMNMQLWNMRSQRNIENIDKNMMKEIG